MFKIAVVKNANDQIEGHSATAQQMQNVSHVVCDGRFWIFHEHGDPAPEAAAPKGDNTSSVTVSRAELAELVTAGVDAALKARSVAP